MGDYQADTLRDTLKTNWALTGDLAKSGTAGNVGQPVYFMAHPQIPSKEHRKAVIVRKLTPLENVVSHAKFDEVNDVFEIQIYYVVAGISLATYDNSEKDREDMTDEVLRILKTVYNPLTTTGTYFRTNQAWKNDDDVTSKDQVLKSTLSFTLTKIRSADTTVFKGYGGVLSYDTSASTGDDKPSGDYIYTEAYDVKWVGGFKQIPELTDVTAQGEHVPVWFTGAYNGRFNCMINMKKADWTDTGSEQFPIIGNPLTNGEIADVVFLWVVTNTESSPATLTATIALRVISIEPAHDLEDISKFQLICQITKPPTYALT